MNGIVAYALSLLARPGVTDELIQLWWVLVGLIIVGAILEIWGWRYRGKSRLADMRARQLRNIARKYQVKLTGKAGNTWSRVAFFGLYIYFIGRMLTWATSFVPMPANIRWTMVVVATSLLVLLTIKMFVVNVPKLAFVIVTNLFTGRMHVLTPGLKIKFPWERYNRGRVVLTEEERRVEHSDVLSQRSGEIKRTTRFTSRDGIGVTFENWIIQWGVFMPLGPLNIRYEGESVSDTIEDISESMLNQEVLKRDIEDFRDPAAIDILEDLLTTRLGSRDEGAPDAFGNTIEERTGVAIEIGTLGPMKFDDDYIQAISTKKIIGLMRVEAGDLASALHMDGGQALDTILMVNKEGVTRQVFKFETDPSTRGALEGVGSGIAKAAASVAAAIAGVRKPDTGGGSTPPPSDTHGGH